jgi:hypothetical protein
MGEGTEVCDMFFQSRHTFIRYCVVLPYPVPTNKSMIVRDRISVTNILNVSHNDNNFFRIDSKLTDEIP